MLLFCCFCCFFYAPRIEFSKNVPVLKMTSEKNPLYNLPNPSLEYIVPNILKAWNQDPVCSCGTVIACILVAIVLNGQVTKVIKLIFTKMTPNLAAKATTQPFFFQ